MIESNSSSSSGVRDFSSPLSRTACLRAMKSFRTPMAFWTGEGFAPTWLSVSDKFASGTLVFGSFVFGASVLDTLVSDTDVSEMDVSEPHVHDPLVSGVLVVGMFVSDKSMSGMSVSDNTRGVGS